MGYQPQPADLSGIILDQEIRDSIDKIARNVHEVWALERLDQGWRYGESMSRGEKTHPSLVPYDELPEKEKVLDVKTTEQVIKMLLHLGFRIEKG